MNRVRVLQLVRSLGGNPGFLRVVGCEPAILKLEAGAMGLSEKLRRGRARHRNNRGAHPQNFGGKQERNRRKVAQNIEKQDLA